MMTLPNLVQKPRWMSSGWDEHSKHTTFHDFIYQALQMFYDSSSRPCPEPNQGIPARCSAHGYLKMIGQPFRRWWKNPFILHHQGTQTNRLNRSNTKQYQTVLKCTTPKNLSFLCAVFTIEGVPTSGQIWPTLVTAAGRHRHAPHLPWPRQTPRRFHRGTGSSWMTPSHLRWAGTRGTLGV